MVRIKQQSEFLDSGSETLDSDLEGRHAVVLRWDGLLFSFSLLIAESDSSIFLISFYETYDRGSLPSRINIDRVI